MERADVGVEDVDWLPFLWVWKLPGLLEVFGAVFEEEVVAVLV